MQFDDVYDLIKDNGDNIIDLTYDNNLEVIETQIKDKTIDFNQNDEIYLLTECLRVNEIRYTIFPMEYPPTSLEGIAVCYNIENWGSYEPAFENIQYMTGKPMGGGEKPIWSSYLNCNVKKYYRTCTGVKHCMFLKDSIKNSTHTEVDMNKDLTQHNNEIARLQKSKEAKTYTKYLATLELKCPYNKSNCLGDFVVQKRSNNDPNATDMWFIGCSRWWEKEAGKGKHFFQRLKEDIDPILLGKLFNRESINLANEADSCSVVLSTKSHSTKCGFLHQYTNGGMEEGKIIKKALTYTRVFTNITNATSYERMFSLLFNWIYQLTGSNPKIFHIDNTGWKCILGDLDRAQAKGLGLALNRLYPNLTWEEHLTHIFKSCRIHYNRNIKNNKYPNNVKQLMYEYPNANTIERVEEIIQELKNSQEPNINDWILFYTISWVRASLNILYSFISEDTWYMSPDNTNVAESCHANENQDGKSLSLEVAILRAKKYDERNFVTCQTQDQYGIRKTGKDHRVVMREKQAMCRSMKRGQSSNKVESFTTQKGNKSRKVAKTHVIDDLEKEKQMISLKEKKLELEEKELKLEKEKLELEKERLELLKSKRELGFTE
ncbi:unnamed protein product [Rhizophagus irregularis]|nr:unnamed protein product [Rhizophagus irregularis]